MYSCPLPYAKGPFEALEGNGGDENCEDCYNGVMDRSRSVQVAASRLKS